MDLPRVRPSSKWPDKELIELTATLVFLRSDTEDMELLQLTTRTEEYLQVMTGQSGPSIIVL